MLLSIRCRWGVAHGLVHYAKQGKYFPVLLCLGLLTWLLFVAFSTTAIFPLKTTFFETISAHVHVVNEAFH